MNRLTVSDFTAHNHVPTELRFESGELDLTGFLFTPTGPGPFPCVINNHGSNLRPDSSMVSKPGLAALHLDWGYAFFFSTSPRLRPFTWPVRFRCNPSHLG